jgi:CNT family concentrative nucleoside transporter
MLDVIRAIVGVSFLVFLAWIASGNRSKISWKLVGGGLALQLLLGVMIHFITPVKAVFRGLSAFFVQIINFTEEGTGFLFGAQFMEDYGNTFVIKGLPVLIFFSTLTYGLQYLGILQKIVYAFAWLMSKTMKLSGAESLSAAGNVFLGQTEAPMMVRPFISRMTRSELMCLMTGGMATIAGSVLATYVAFLGGESSTEQADYAMFLLTASVMNAPAAVVMAKMIVPETKFESINKELVMDNDDAGVNIIDALARGALAGLKLALNVGAMLLAFIALIAMINYFFKDVIGEYTGLNEIIIQSTNGIFDGLSMEYLLGNVFRPIAWATGVDWSDTLLVGSLLGKKVVVNEFVAYIDLGEMIRAGMLSDKSRIIATFALCGFANFASIAIQIGGIGGMAPNRQGDISRLGMRALLAGMLATLLTGTLAGVLVH